MTADALEQRCAALAAQSDFSRDDIDELCRLALDSNESLRSLGTRTLFASIVERLSDGFDPAGAAIYDRIFAQVIDTARRHPDGLFLDAALARFGLRTESDLLNRKLRLSQGRFDVSSTKRILVLSRVTLGADICVTSVMVNALAALHPQASIALVGQPPIGDLYHPSGKLEVLTAPYARHGSLLDRLRSWTDLVALVDRERQAFAREEFCVVDPDSRLTQLGLLPLLEGGGPYFFFESRSFQQPGLESLSDLAAAWSADAFGAGPGKRPFVHLAPGHLDRGRRAVRPFRARGARVAAFNFGVGGNESKRLDFDFEVDLALRAIQQGYGLIVDKGAGNEAERVNRIVERLRTAGRFVAELEETAQTIDPPPNTDVVTWRGGPGAFGGFIAAADVYVGYDSAFQHVAAALAVPVIDLFVRQFNERFIARWTPSSTAPVHVMRMDVAEPASAAADRVLKLLPSCG